MHGEDAVHIGIFVFPAVRSGQTPETISRTSLPTIAVHRSHCHSFSVQHAEIVSSPRRYRKRLRRWRGMPRAMTPVVSSCSLNPFRAWAALRVYRPSRARGPVRVLRRRFLSTAYPTQYFPSAEVALYARFALRILQGDWNGDSPLRSMAIIPPFMPSLMNSTPWSKMHSAGQVVECFRIGSN